VLGEGAVAVAVAREETVAAVQEEAVLEVHLAAVPAVRLLL